MTESAAHTTDSGSVAAGSRRRGVILTANLASALFITGALGVGYFGISKTPQRPGDSALRRLSNSEGRTVDIAGSPVLGHTAAPVVVVEFSDFECPFCRAFALQTFPKLRESHIETGKVRFVFRHFPLDAIHPAARPAAVASMCAARVGGFWKVHDALFQDARIAPSRARELIGDASTRASEFDRCLLEPPVTVDRDERDADALGIASTPTFLLGHETPEGVRVERSMIGAISYNEFVREIETVARARAR